MPDPSRYAADSRRQRNVPRTAAENAIAVEILRDARRREIVRTLDAGEITFAEALAQLKKVRL